MEDATWKRATAAAFCAWLLLLLGLMVADVWDETNGMVFFGGSPLSFGEKVRFVLTHSLGFWRPLPTLLAVAVLHSVPDFAVSWKLLRLVNIVMLGGATWLFGSVLESEWRDRFLLTVTILYSGSAVISAGWYANIFDVSALLTLALATRVLLVGQQGVLAGVLIGSAFYCKETAALGFPFLLMLAATGRITRRQLFEAGLPAAALGTLYFATRATIIPLGSATDIHGFAAGQFLPTLLRLTESFWLQTMKGEGPGFAGLVIFLISMASLRRPRLIAAGLLLVAATTVLYWGMLSTYQNGVLIHYLNFIGRLYLIPASLTLVVLALEQRRLMMAVLLLPLMFGAMATYRDHARFQETYRQIYLRALESPRKPLLVHYPEKTLEDTVRGIRIGNYPDAPLKIDPSSGQLRHD